VRTGYVNPTDRVAAALIAAVKPWQAKHASDLKRLQAIADGRLLLACYGRMGHPQPVTAINDLIVWLAKQIAHQGLMPNDLDSVDGTAAIAAVADAIFSGKKKAAYYTALPVEWKHVASAAWRILDREAVGRRR
jgi:hypothetical protein